MTMPTYERPKPAQKMSPCKDCRYTLYAVPRKAGDTDGKAKDVWVDSTGSRLCRRGARQGRTHLYMQGPRSVQQLFKF